MSKFSRNFLSGLSTTQIKKEIKRREEEKRQKKDEERRQEVGMSLYELRDVELGPELAAKLAPFVYAYRPNMSYDDAKARREKMDRLFEKVRGGSFMDDERERYFEIKGCYPEEASEFTNS